MILVTGAGGKTGQAVVAALAARGAGDIRPGGDGLEFRGITNYRSFSPLSNIARGRIKVDDRGLATSLTYSIVIDPTPFVASFVLAVASLVLITVGVPQFGFFAVFGAAVLALSCVYSLVIRLRFPRWLRRALAEP